MKRAANLRPDFWRGRRVLLTGHTGFKGSWLALWLQRLGAHVTGISLPPNTTPSLFELARVAETYCDGRIVLVTEGGYDQRALAASLDAVIQTLVSSPAQARWPTSGIAPDRGRAAVEAATRALAPFWKIT